MLYFAICILYALFLAIIDSYYQMKRSMTVLDKIVLLCRDVEKTSAIYCDALGLKMVLQSPDLVELRDNNDLRIFLKAT